MIFEAISPGELKRALDEGRCIAIDLRSSTSFRKGHVPGSHWSIRPRLVAAAGQTTGRIVLIADDTALAQLGAIDLSEAGFTAMKCLEGGVGAWTAAGYPIEASPGMPPDADRIDYLFFVHDRHAGNREAMKQYLAWETGLLAQLDEQDRASFKVGVPNQGEYPAAR